MCCLTVGDSPSYKAATSFDMGAHASYVNWEVAAWVEGQARRNPSFERKARGTRTASHYGVTGWDSMQQPDIRVCSLRLTFFNEVSRLHETIRNITA
jgi:saccharopine dehydrogenase-like NADP-dependent oxidoreductase